MLFYASFKINRKHTIQNLARLIFEHDRYTVSTYVTTVYLYHACPAGIVQSLTSILLVWPTSWTPAVDCLIVCM